jgi:transposase-like protein
LTASGTTFGVRLITRGDELEALVTKRRDRKEALKFVNKLMKRRGRPHIFVNDKFHSYGATLKEIGNADKQKTGGWQTLRASHWQPMLTSTSATRSRLGNADRTPEEMFAECVASIG